VLVVVCTLPSLLMLQVKAKHLMYEGLTTLGALLVVRSVRV
jgi:hypothetical protein